MEVPLLNLSAHPCEIILIFSTTNGIKQKKSYSSVSCSFNPKRWCNFQALLNPSHNLRSSDSCVACCLDLSGCMSWLYSSGWPHLVAQNTYLKSTRSHRPAYKAHKQAAVGLSRCGCGGAQGGGQDSNTGREQVDTASAIREAGHGVVSAGRSHRYHRRLPRQAERARICGAVAFA